MRKERLPETTYHCVVETENNNEDCIAPHGKIVMLYPPLPGAGKEIKAMAELMEENSYFESKYTTTIVKQSQVIIKNHIIRKDGVHAETGNQMYHPDFYKSKE